MFPADVDFSTTAEDGAAKPMIDLTKLGKSLAFDYKTDRFVLVDGKNKIPTKIESIKQWIELYLRTAVNKYLIYSSDFGVDFSDLVGYRLPSSYQVSEIIRRVNSGILNKCPCVSEVKNWSFDGAKGFSFTVVTNTGEEVKISE